MSSKLIDFDLSVTLKRTEGSQWGGTRPVINEGRLICYFICLISSYDFNLIELTLNFIELNVIHHQNTPHTFKNTFFCQLIELR